MGALVALAAAVVSSAPARTLPQESQPVEQIVIGGVTPRFAVPDCVPRGQDAASQAACKTITQVLRNDLRFEGLFQFVPDSLLTAIPPQNPDAPNFEDWKGIGARILVVSRAQVTGNELKVEVRVHFVDSGQSMLAKSYTGKADNPRVFAHQASDDIMTLTQYKGVAKTRIAFVSDRDAPKDRRGTKELYVVDYDGYNPRRVTVNGSLNLLPAWSPDGQGLAYTSYRQGVPVIYLARIFEGRSVANVTGERDGSQAFSPSFASDGRIAFASNRAGGTDIYVANGDGSNVRRLTTTRANDTAPCWSPTGQEIAFTSDRAGTPQLWLMDSEGLNVRRLTVNVGNWNDGCAWNPAKQYSEIAYTARLEGGGFDIAVMDLATRQVRQITQGRGSCEYPSWAPNGRHLVFSCNRGNRWEITISDRDGRSLQTLATGPGNNVQPDWGP
jgi:TolB protein